MPHVDGVPHSFPSLYMLYYTSILARHTGVSATATQSLLGSARARLAFRIRRPEKGTRVWVTRTARIQIAAYSRAALNRGLQKVSKLRNAH